MKILFLIAAGAAFAGASAHTAAQGSPAQPAAAQPAPPPFVAPAPIRQIVDQQLGTRYGGSEKEAIARCATAALAKGAILSGVIGYAGIHGYPCYEGTCRAGGIVVSVFPGINIIMRDSASTDSQRWTD